MNSWGFTAGAQSAKDGSITYTWKHQKLASSGEFKFASCHGWKINLDEDGIVKAEVSFGPGSTPGTLGVGTDNIAVDKTKLTKGNLKVRLTLRLLLFHLKIMPVHHICIPVRRDCLFLLSFIVNFEKTHRLV